MTCTQVKGCTVRCHDGLVNPEDKRKYYIACRRPGVWKVELYDFEPQAGCKHSWDEEEETTTTTEKPTVALVIESLQFLTADYFNAGMSKWTGGKFYSRIIGARAECSTGHLDNEENNWQRGEVCTRKGSM